MEKEILTILNLIRDWNEGNPNHPIIARAIDLGLKPDGSQTIILEINFGDTDLFEVWNIFESLLGPDYKPEGWDLVHERTREEDDTLLRVYESQPGNLLIIQETNSYLTITLINSNL